MVTVSGLGAYRGIKGDGIWQRYGLWLLAAALCLLIGVVATAALRVWQVRDVVWPLWGDAGNHTAAVALFLQQQGLPSDWGAYIPTSTTFSYHFGFHAWAATISWLTDVPSWWAVFWTERFLSAITPLSLYLLGYALFRDPRVALGAALATGLLTLMPQYYVNWSRDPQLGGQVLLPLVGYLALSVARHPQGRARGASLLAVSTAGLVFSHYRVMVFAFAMLLGLLVLVARRGTKPADAAWPAAGVLAGAALGAPWVLRVLAVQRQAAAATPVAYADGFVDVYFAAPPLPDYVQPCILLLAALGLVIGLRRWRRQSLALAVWLLAMLVAANGYRTGISTLSLITYIAVFMVLYMPLGLCFGMLLEALPRQAARPLSPLLIGWPHRAVIAGSPPRRYLAAPTCWCAPRTSAPLTGSPPTRMRMPASWSTPSLPPARAAWWSAQMPAGGCLRRPAAAPCCP